MEKTYPLSGTIFIGNVGENESREIALDISALRRQWPELSPSLVVRRPTETDVYPAVTRLDGDTLIWTVTEEDTAISGIGEARVFMMSTDGIKRGKSRIVLTNIGEGMEGEMSGSVPIAIQPWIEDITAISASVQKGAQEAKTSAAEAQDAAQSAGQNAREALEAAETAGQIGDEAERHARDSAEYAGQSKMYATLAEQSAATHGFFYTYIGDDGHLHYVRSDGLADLNLRIEDGRLKASYGME